MSGNNTHPDPRKIHGSEVGHRLIRGTRESRFKVSWPSLVQVGYGWLWLFAQYGLLTHGEYPILCESTSIVGVHRQFQYVETYLNMTKVCLGRKTPRYPGWSVIRHIRELIFRSDKSVLMGYFRLGCLSLKMHTTPYVFTELTFISRIRWSDYLLVLKLLSVHAIQCLFVSSTIRIGLYNPRSQLPCKKWWFLLDDDKPLVK